MVTERINSAKDLRVYKKAYALAMEIYQLSKSWPVEEKYSLTDQEIFPFCLCKPA